MKLHVIGDPDAVLGFSLIGLTGQVALSAPEVEEALELAARNPEIGVVFITERAAALAPEALDSYRRSNEGPIVVEIPGPEGPLASRLALRDVIARATGVRV
ncbi:MAG: ATPase [Chloroflexi bacterium]|nr:ATPase [Chloroflexota bacterium]